MLTRTVPFNYGLFYHAMVNLLGREPDRRHRYGWDGMHLFRYEPKNETEEKKFSEGAYILREWLSIFELVPLHSHCEYGRLLEPQDGEENKDYLDIKIVFPIEKKEDC